MANTLEIKVPDIGGHDGVPVIEVLVKVGDTVEKEQSLITLESDKATMEIPSSAAGVITELKLKVGDEVSEGVLIAVLKTTDADDTKAASPSASEGRNESARTSGASNEAVKDAPSSASTRPSPQSSPQGGAEAKVPQAAAASGRAADIECKLVVL
ncbi:MAG: dihydrolipoyl dehydrogenase, partial [Pseudomonadota bacterium]|nr:dihydrolipoyl dehydrogenase [Pseudomonadota bacterium]